MIGFSSSSGHLNEKVENVGPSFLLAPEVVESKDDLQLVGLSVSPITDRINVLVVTLGITWHAVINGLVLFEPYGELAGRSPLAYRWCWERIGGYWLSLSANAAATGTRTCRTTTATWDVICIHTCLCLLLDYA